MLGNTNIPIIITVKHVYTISYHFDYYQYICNSYFKDYQYHTLLTATISLTYYSVSRVCSNLKKLETCYAMVFRI